MNKSLENLQLDLIEVQAYRINQDYKDKEYYTVWWIYDVDRNEKDDPTSEDEYFSIIEQNLKEAIEYYDINNPKPTKKRQKLRLSKYERKKITQQKLEKLKGICAYYVVGTTDDNRLYRCYLSKRKTGRTHMYKRISNHKVRKNSEFKLKGNSYRKVFDYWWEVD